MNRDDLTLVINTEREVEFVFEGPVLGIDLLVLLSVHYGSRFGFLIT